jgi:adenosylcobinamide-GDP ribazoletransferase
MKGLLIALQFMTRLPGPRLTVSDAEFSASMRWFPAVGGVIGAIVAGASWLGAHVDAWTGALAGLVVWVGVTGALHLDGLADIADAAGAAHKGPGRVREVLADPHLGSFGTSALVLQALAKLVLLHALIVQGVWLPLIAVPFAARIGPLVWTRTMTPLHAGLGARFAGVIRPVDLALWGLILLGAAWFAPGLLATVPAIALWRRWILRRIGGISGDGMGAGIELVESLLLLALSIGAIGALR